MAYEINININYDRDEEVSLNNEQQNYRTNGSNITKSLSNYIASQAIEPMIQKSINYLTSNVELTTGSIAQQQRTDAIMQATSLGSSAYRNASAGAAFATSIGMNGGVGAVLGIAMTAINLGLDILFKQAQIELKKQQEENQRVYLYQRSGMAYSQSRRGS